MELVSEIGVLGAGQMGIGVAQVAAQSGFKVILCDRSAEIAQQGRTKILSILKKQVDKGKIQQAEVDKVDGAIQIGDGISGLKNSIFIIEAVTENPELKYQLFRQLDEACPKEAILATNTSSISITSIAAQTKRPDKVGGIHFMNPVPLMKLVEGIRGLQTSNETFSTIRNVAERMGKTFIEAKDIPGFAVNRILMPMINEAVTVVYEGIAALEDIDTAMRLGTNQPMGPLALADLIGLDTCLAIMKVLHDGLGDSKYRPCPLLKQYVEAGWYGKKSGRGFYKYE